MAAGTNDIIDVLSAVRSAADELSQALGTTQAKENTGTEEEPVMEWVYPVAIRKFATAAQRTAVAAMATKAERWRDKIRDSQDAVDASEPAP